MTGVKTFENKEASKFFAELSSEMKPEQRQAFTKSVLDLYDRKVTGEEEHEVYKVTKEDLLVLAERIVANIK